MRRPEAVRSYWGLTTRFVCDDEALLLKIFQILPQPSEPNEESSEATTVFEIRSEGEKFSLYHDENKISSGRDEDQIIESLESAFMMNLATNAPDAVFVHAGVVALEGRCLLLPGPSFAGKSTLVHALGEMGAEYYSDEYAVIDKEGWLHPYRRPLSLRQINSKDLRVSPAKYPVTSRHARSRLVLVVDCKYRKNGRWKLKSLTHGESILALFSNTVSAQLSPERDLSWLAGAVTDETRCFRTERGEAISAARKLLILLRAFPVRATP